jgi:hypothetical protein
VNRRTRTAAVIGALGLACTGLAVAPTALAAAAAPEDPGCTVSYTTTPVAGPGATVTGLPKEIDFGTNLPAAAGYKVVFHGTPSKLATGFVRAQVVINGNSPPQTDGFNWGNRSPIAGNGTVSQIWKPNPRQFTAGKSYSLDHNDSHAIENDFYAKGQTEVPKLTLSRAGSKVTIVALTKRFVLSAAKFEPRAEPVQLYASTNPTGAHGHRVATGKTNAAGKFAFHVTASKKLTYFVVIPTTAYGTTSSSKSYAK